MNTMNRIGNLPTELLEQILEQLEDIQDVLHFMQTCKLFHLVAQRQWETVTKTLQHSFPLAYVAISATKIRQWAELNRRHHNSVELCLSQIDSLQLLATLVKKYISVTMTDVRTLAKVQEEVIPPLCSRLATATLMFTYAQRAFTHNGQPALATIDDPVKAIYTFWIYCELFAADIDYAKSDTAEARSNRFRRNARLGFIRGTVPHKFDFHNQVFEGHNSDWNDLSMMMRTSVWLSQIRSLFPPPLSSWTWRDALAYIILQHGGLNTLKLVSKDWKLKDFKQLPRDLQNFVYRTLSDSRKARLENVTNNGPLDSNRTLQQQYAWSGLSADLGLASDFHGMHCVGCAHSINVARTRTFSFFP